jgi:hypothetical protein
MTCSEIQTTHSRSKPRLQYSLRMLLMVVAGSGVVIGLAARAVIGYRSQILLEGQGVVVEKAENAFQRVGNLTFQPRDRVATDLHRAFASDNRRYSLKAAAWQGFVGVRLYPLERMSAPPEDLDISDLLLLASIKCLAVEGRLHVRHPESLARMQRLEFVAIRGNLDVDDSIVPPLLACKRLRVVDLSTTSLSDAGLDALLRHGQLDAIYVRDTLISKQAFSVIGKSARLTHLDVSRGAWLASPFGKAEPVSSWLWSDGDRGPFDEFARPVAMQYADSDEHAQIDTSVFPDTRRALDVSGALPVDDAAFPKTLRWLDVSGWRLSHPALERIIELPDLEYVNLAAQSVHKDLLEKLASSSRIRSLGLADCPIGDDHVPLLLKLDRLESLDLRGTAISLAGCRALAESSSLRRLYFDAEKGDHSIPLDDLPPVLKSLKTRELFIECGGGNSVQKRIERLASEHVHESCTVR